jgi:predicted transcriptional regulator
LKRTVQENRRTTVADIAEALNISHDSAYSILHDTLNW